MNIFLLIPFVAQAIVITFDEFYFHWKRGLPKWERIGHPIDTLSLLLCVIFVMVFPFSSKALVAYIILAVISCFCVTKDEWVHKEHCNAKEQWLHALLFLNHPIVLISLGFMWPQNEIYFGFLLFQNLFISLFFFYQIIYWNFVWQQK